MIKRKPWFFLFLIFSLIGLLMIPFIITFWNNKISNQINDWGAFGSYFSIIISAANLVVFIYLTIYISKLDENRNVNQINAQYKITLAQFRQTEMTELGKRLNLIFENFETKIKTHITGNLINNSNYLNNFFNEKTYLFPNLNNNDMAIRNENFQSICSQLISIVDEYYGTEISEEHNKSLETKITVLFLIRNEIIKELQTFILEDLKL